MTSGIYRFKSYVDKYRQTQSLPKLFVAAAVVSHVATYWIVRYTYTSLTLRPAGHDDGFALARLLCAEISFGDRICSLSPLALKVTA